MRKRVAHEVLLLKTMAEIRSAWDGYDAKDPVAVARRLGRAREFRAMLRRQELLDTSLASGLPDLDAIQKAMSGRVAGREVREARRTFASWEHNTHVSQILHMFPRRARDDDER
jgi:hypothetical protein